MMTDEKQTLSPAEWKSVSDYVMELSERMEKATSSIRGKPIETRKGTPPTDRGND